MVLLFDALTQVCLEQGLDKTYCLAYSGGVDSTVLLHALATLRSLYPIKIKAVHVHHGLSPHADAWARHCEQTCAEYGVTFSMYQVDATARDGKSREEVARQSRYAVFAKLMTQNDILLTAHHQDDQAETLLLQLTRGAGPKGLAAMPVVAKFHAGLHVRPLLNCSRETLHHYAEEHHLHWVDDESNDDCSYSRNFIRHEVLPLLKTRWVSITETLARVASHCAESQHLIETMSETDLSYCYGSRANTLSVKKLLGLPLPRLRQVLRLWFVHNHFRTPSTVKLQHIIHDVLHAAVDKQPLVRWGDVEVRRYRDDIYVMHALREMNLTDEHIWDLDSPLTLADGRVLTVDHMLQQGVLIDVPLVIVRFRRGGETIRLPGREHSHMLQKLFQEWGVPPWLRDRTPLIYVGDELRMVYRIDGY